MQTFRRCAGVQEALRRNEIGSTAYGTCARRREAMPLARRSTPGLNLASTFATSGIKLLYRTPSHIHPGERRKIRDIVGGAVCESDTK